MQINFNRNNKVTTLAEKIVGTVFFSIFLLMGTSFFVMMIYSLYKKMEWAVAGFLLIPLIFMAVGAGGIYLMWKKKCPEDKSGAAAVKKMNPANQRRFLALFFSVFFLAGAGFGWGFVVHPLLKIKESKNWSKKPCTITFSGIKESRGDDSTTYKVDIRFKYRFSGVEYVSNTYDFMTGSDSDYSSKRKVIQRYPVGKSTYCYVNPESPDEAVISREFNNPWWIALLPLVFILVGAGGVIGTLMKKKKQSHIYSSKQDIVKSDGETVLKMKSSPLKNFIGVCIFSLFWNGIVSIFVTIAVKSWYTDNVEWFLSFFIIPFVLVGLASIGGIFYYFIAMFNSKAVLSITNSHPEPGEKVTLSWEIVNSSSVEKLEIFLKGEESATYQTHGKNNNTHTRKSTFESLKLLETDNRDAIHIGRTQFTIPSNTMHSFDGKNNKITWEIHLRGEIKRRPDLKYDYPITVMPLSQESLHRVLRSAEGDDNG